MQPYLAQSPNCLHSQPVMSGTQFYGWVNQSPNDDIAVVGLKLATLWLRVLHPNHCAITAGLHRIYCKINCPILLCASHAYLVFYLITFGVHFSCLTHWFACRCSVKWIRSILTTKFPIFLSTIKPGPRQRRFVIYSRLSDHLWFIVGYQIICDLSSVIR